MRGTRSPSACEATPEPRRACRRPSEARDVVRPEGLEPPTCGFEGRRSIQMSYGRVRTSAAHQRAAPHVSVARGSAGRSQLSGGGPFRGFGDTKLTARPDEPASAAAAAFHEGVDVLEVERVDVTPQRHWVFPPITGPAAESRGDRCGMKGRVQDGACPIIEGHWPTCVRRAAVPCTRQPCPAGLCGPECPSGGVGTWSGPASASAVSLRGCRGLGRPRENV